MNLKSLVKQALMERENRKYARCLQARRVTYGEWCRKREAEWEPGVTALQEAGLPGQNASESAWAIFASDRGVLSEQAERLIGAYFETHPEVQILYGDEDVWENFPAGERYMPWFKPDWSPDLFEGSFYFGNVAAVRTEFLIRLQDGGWIKEKARGTGNRRRLQEEQIRRWVRLAGGYEPGSKAIGHIPEVLFHCDSMESILHGCSQISKELSASMEPPAPTETEASAKALVSVVIPSRDHPGILSSCVAAIPKAAGAIPCEVIVVDNGSSAENKAAAEEMLAKLPVAAKYIYEPMEFHFSRMCNLGAEEAEGDFLLFLNDDVELCTAGCIEKMYRLASRSFTGAVGMKLYYPGSVKIQHAGITNLPMGPVHKLQFLEDNASWYFDSNRGNRNMLAVTAACLMSEKKKFFQAGGFSEKLRVAFNDVDFCFKLWELGYSNVCMNDIYAYHHESLSRGNDEAPEKLNRLLAEREVLYQRHPGLEGYDPYYSIHLNRQGLDTGIRPAYETAGNSLQECREVLQKKELSGYRQDDCLLVRVESVQNGEICGYRVVLGDNNACYESWLLLQKEAFESGEEGLVYGVRTEGQYRPDLVENMPDQQNTGLCGLWIKIDRKVLSQGDWRIGAAVRNRVTGTKLINWTNYRIRIS